MPNRERQVLAAIGLLTAGSVVALFLLALFFLTGWWFVIASCAVGMGAVCSYLLLDYAYKETP